MYVGWHWQPRRLSSSLRPDLPLLCRTATAFPLRAAQNIARGQTSVAQVFGSWFNESPPNDGHRQNILSSELTQMGAGWNQGANLWTQNFGASDTEPCT